MLCMKPLDKNKLEFANTLITVLSKIFDEVENDGDDNKVVFPKTMQGFTNITKYYIHVFCPDLRVRARRVTQKKALSEDEFEYKPKGDLGDHLIVESASLLFKQSSLLFFFHYQHSPHSLLSTFYNPFLYFHFHPFEL